MKKIFCFIATLLLAVSLMAQGNPARSSGGQPSQGKKLNFAAPGMRHDGDRMGTPMGFPFGAWWKDPDIAQQINLTDDQSQKIDKVFQDARVQLVDLHTNLQKEESTLRPLVDADQPDEAKVMAQVDKIAQARAALERANASMMLAIRRVLSPDQWKKLQERSPGRRHYGERPDGPPPRPNGDGGDD
jgi:Spy/CpxP family protein refolding chaperone